MISLTMWLMVGAAFLMTSSSVFESLAALSLEIMSASRIEYDEERDAELLGASSPLRSGMALLLLRFSSMNLNSLFRLSMRLEASGCSLLPSSRVRHTQFTRYWNE